MIAGFSTLGCWRYSLPQVAELARRYNFSKVELRFLDGREDLNHVLEKTENKKLFMEMLDAGFFHVLDSSFFITDPFCEDKFNAFAAMAEFASRYGIRYLRVFGGSGSVTDAQRLENAARHLALFDKLNLNVELALETHDIYSSAEKAVAFMTKIGRRMPVIWDMHHSYISGEDFRTSYALLQGLIVGIHIKDSIITGTNHINTIPGAGDIPVKDFLRFMEDEKEQSPIILEYEERWSPELPPIEIALEAMVKNWKH